LEFILDDLTTVDPDDAALSAFLRENADLFRLEPRVSFRQVYLNPDKRNELAADADRLLAELNRGSPPESLGDPTMAAYEHSLATRSDIARWFGNSFAEQVVAMQPGGWEGPLYSGLGAHLVRVTERREGRMPELDEVRKQVEREYVAKRRKEAKDIAYAKLREKYEVILQPPAAEGGEAEDGAFASTRTGEAAR
jgi:hypothetical protein